MDELLKDGGSAVNIGFYKEKLFQKIDSGSDAIVRSLGFSGVRHGKVLVVGIDQFVIRDGDGENITISFSDILDLE